MKKLIIFYLLFSSFTLLAIEKEDLPGSYANLDSIKFRKALKTNESMFYFSFPNLPKGENFGIVYDYNGGPGKSVYLGKGVLKAVQNVTEIIKPALLGKDADNQREVDNIMLALDGTETKSKLGANAILAVSMAVAKSAAISKKIPLYVHLKNISGSTRDFSLPMPMINIVNGGQHAANSTDIQEFMIQPIGGRDFAHRMQMSAEIFHNLKKVIA